MNRLIAASGNARYRGAAPDSWTSTRSRRNHLGGRMHRSHDPGKARQNQLHRQRSRAPPRRPGGALRFLNDPSPGVEVMNRETRIKPDSRLSGEQAAEILQLLDKSSSVELKVTVAEGHHGVRIKRL